MEIIEVDIFQTQESTSRTLGIVIAVEIEQTQSASTEVGSAGETILEIQPAFVTGLPKAVYEKPKQYRPVCALSGISAVEMQANIGLEWEGQLHFQLNTTKDQVYLYVAMNIAGDGQDERLELVQMSTSRTNRQNRQTGTTWRGRKGNSIGEAL